MQGLGGWALFYGCAAISVFWFCCWVAVNGAARLAAPALCSAMLLLTWFVSLFASVIIGKPYDVVANFPMDLICGTVVALMYRARPRVWTAGLALCFLTQALSHVWFVGLDPPANLNDAGRRHDYRLWLNLVFIAELACVSLPGLLCVGDAVRTWMRRRSVWRRVVGVGTRREG